MLFEAWVARCSPISDLCSKKFGNCWYRRCCVWLLSTKLHHFAIVDNRLCVEESEWNRCVKFRMLIRWRSDWFVYLLRLVFGLSSVITYHWRFYTNKPDAPFGKRAYIGHLWQRLTFPPFNLFVAFTSLKRDTRY